MISEILPPSARRSSVAQWLNDPMARWLNVFADKQPPFILS
jgi:hypothetical protein